jgi:dTMP kinase
VSAGRFLTFEGTEGSGKTSQLLRLAETLRGSGVEIVATREPGGGTPVGEAIRSLLLDPECWRSLGLAEIYLYAAARAEHLEKVVEPALERGAVVLCDRYLDSTVAYQGYGRGRPLELIRALHELPPLRRRPGLTLLLDLEPELGLDRARSRNRRDGDPEGGRGYDDEELAFHRRVRRGFLDLAREEPGRVRVVDAAAPEAEVAREVARLAADFLGLPPAGAP